MRKILIILTAIILSCNNTGQNNAGPDSTIVQSDSIAPQDDTTQKEILSNNETNDSVINIRFPKDSTWVTVVGKMKGLNRPVAVYIPVKQGRQLTVSISSDDSTANVRINQMITPDGEADGPFGRDFTWTIHQQGTYQLLIGQNLMQGGDEWKGDFKLTVRVK